MRWRLCLFECCATLPALLWPLSPCDVFISSRLWCARTSSRRRVGRTRPRTRIVVDEACTRCINNNDVSKKRMHIDGTDYMPNNLKTSDCTIFGPSHIAFHLHSFIWKSLVPLHVQHCRIAILYKSLENENRGNAVHRRSLDRWRRDVDNTEPIQR